MIKSALMTSSVQTVVKEDGVTPADPFDTGAGSIRADRAVNPTLVFDETFEDFVASASDPLHRIDLNLASVDAPTMTGSDHDQADGDERQRQGPAAGGLDRGPGRRHDHRHRDKAATRTAHGDSEERQQDPPEEERHDRHLDHDQRAGGWRTASTSAGSRSIRRRQARNAVDDPGRIRQAAGHRHADARLHADDASRRRPGRATARRASRTSAAAGRRQPDGDEPRQGQGLDFTNVSAPASAIKKDDGIQWSGTLTPALPADRRLDQRRHGQRAGGRLPAAVALRASPSSRHRRRHDHELQRADVLLRRRAVLAGRRRRRTGTS